MVAYFEPLYEEKKNPVFACMAWSMALELDCRPAHFAVDYFRRCSLRVVGSLSQEKDQQSTIREMFEFDAEGQGDHFTQARNSLHGLRIAGLVDDAIAKEKKQGSNQSNLNIFAKVADECSDTLDAPSMEQVQRWYYQYGELARRGSRRISDLFLHDERITRVLGEEMTATLRAGRNVRD